MLHNYDTGHKQKGYWTTLIEVATFDKIGFYIWIGKKTAFPIQMYITD